MVTQESGRVGAPTANTRIQSVSRAIRILLEVASQEGGLTVREIADGFGLSLPTSYHMLNTLVDEGVVIKDERRRYTLGPGASVIAEAYNRQHQVPDRYLRALNELAEQSGETAYLSAWRKNAIAVLATVEGSHAVRVAGLSVGYSDNIHARASGKVLLAFASPQVQEEVLAGTKRRKLTPHTITSKAALRQELEAVRRSGIAHDHQEFLLGVECISAPIRENGSVVACITLSCPADRFVTQEPHLIEALTRATASVSQ